jgi:hypothetical protein
MGLSLEGKKIAAHMTRANIMETQFLESGEEGQGGASRRAFKNLSAINFVWWNLSRKRKFQKPR